MYKTLFVYDSNELLSEIKSLDLWGEPSGFIIEDIVNDGTTAYAKMKEKSYDLVITEIRITGMDGLMLLRKAKEDGLCGRIVLCSKFPDYNYARQGIILGAFDYFVTPFEKGYFYQVFNRIKNEDAEEKAGNIDCEKEILKFFENRDFAVHKYTEDMFESIYSGSFNVISADKTARSICSGVTDKVFDIYEWLDLYIDPLTFYNLDSINEGNQNTYKKRYCQIIGDLFNEFCRLFPKAEDSKITEVMLYILNNPESSLKQKDIANELYINSTYLSTIFLAHTKTRFVDYVTYVKIKRAAYLLRKTKIKVTEISERLGYKDMGYFSRLFKKEFDLPPSEFRMCSSCSYEI